MKSTLTRSRSLLLAIGLILAAALVAFALIRQSSATETYLVANHDLATGSQLQAGDFRESQLALGPQAGTYLKQLPKGAVLASAVLTGQLLPRSALALTTNPNYKPLLITPTGELGQSIRVGSLVQLWFVPKQNTESSTAVQLLSQSEVLAIHKTDQSLTSTPTNLELAVPNEALPVVITAIASAGFISVVSEN